MSKSSFLVTSPSLRPCFLSMRWNPRFFLFFVLDSQILIKIDIKVFLLLSLPSTHHHVLVGVCYELQCSQWWSRSHCSKQLRIRKPIKLSPYIIIDPPQMIEHFVERWNKLSTQRYAYTEYRPLISWGRIRVFLVTEPSGLRFFLSSSWSNAYYIITVVIKSYKHQFHISSYWCIVVFWKTTQYIYERLRIFFNRSKRQGRLVLGSMVWDADMSSVSN